MPSDSITILLTLKGRELFTLRWLWHANRVNVPFPILIADGEVHPTVEKLVQDKSTFPNLRVSYCRYEDTTFSDFYWKISDALSKISTPYVMISDNDDFLVGSGIEKSVEFLDANPTYVCAGGAIAHFELRARDKNFAPKLSGQIDRYWYQQSSSYRKYDLNSARASERIVAAYSDFLTVYYNATRVSALRSIMDEIRSFDFARLDNYELFWILGCALRGKAKSDDRYVSYVRQIGTSSNPSHGKEFIRTLVAEPYLEEVRKILGFYCHAACDDDADSQQLRDNLVDIAQRKLTERLRQSLGCTATLKRRVKQVVPVAFANQARLFLEPFRSGKSSAAGGRSLSRAKLLDTIRLGSAPELAAKQERELRDIEDSLGSQEYVDFMLSRASELMAR